ncbi:response regulator [Aliifodinibius sp. S!AR15-10]|uniref:response regulator n=1 Tax=Aliifodinibius sp. S!AR15-10 TaxID=2950437 RepID=UPI00285497AC|nr:response regulator [Aliifodinibius sp. S!AR15-10]MDR8392846.1 response regulator [Aliifodinibius sp. S!AR15-10]
MSMIKALVIDDSKIMRSAVKRALNQLMLADFEYVEAKDGEDALEKFNDEIQIMFVDWNMPNMTGIEFSKAVREQGNEHIPIIMVTAEKSMGKVDKALNEGGADEYITKPFTADKMHKAISRYFDEDGNLINEDEEGEEDKSFFKNILNN